MKLDLLFEDLGLMLDEGQRLSIPLPLTSIAQQLYTAMAEAGASGEELRMDWTDKKYET